MGPIKKRRRDRMQALLIERDREDGRVIAVSERDDDRYVEAENVSPSIAEKVYADPDIEPAEVVNGLNSGVLEVDRSDKMDFEGVPHSRVKAKEPVAEEPPKKTRRKKTVPEPVVESAVEPVDASVDDILEDLE